MKTQQKNKLNSEIALVYPGFLEYEYKKIAKNWKKGRWIQNNNRYEKNTVDNIEDDCRNQKLNKSHMCQYIAASVFLHCVDGWSYYSRSAEASINGDESTSLHLAYYAELRAAMCILASRGIGVFNKEHIVVKNIRNCEKISGVNNGTHDFVWQAFDSWSNTPDANSFLFEIIRPSSIPLSTWLNAFSTGGPRLAILAKNWLQEYGLDLKMLASDRSSRNIHSYRPTEYIVSKKPKFDELLRNHIEIWQILQPSNVGLSNSIDVLFLKKAIFDLYKSSFPNSKINSKLYRQLIIQMLSSVGQYNEKWTEILFENESVFPKLFKDAGTASNITHPSHTVQVRARAAILLHLANNTCRHIISRLADSQVDDLEFWWEEFGSSRGLWLSKNPPENFYDLWADIDESITELNSQLINNGINNSCNKLWTSHSNHASILSSYERVFLWGTDI